MVVDLSWPLSVLLISLRLAALLIMTPILSAIAMPMNTRFLLVLILAALLGAAFPQAQLAEHASWAGLLGSAVRELILGLAMGLGIMVVFAAFSLAGRLLDVQMGFGLGQIFDPVMRTQIPVLSMLFGLLAMASFFAAEGHHAVLRGLAWSLERYPTGQGLVGPDALAGLIRESGGIFSLGLALVAPVVLVLLLLESGLGLLSRSLPQSNMFMLGIPIRVLSGLAALALWLAMANPVVAGIFRGMLRAWEGLFA